MVRRGKPKYLFPANRMSICNLFFFLYTENCLAQEYCSMLRKLKSFCSCLAAKCILQKLSETSLSGKNHAGSSFVAMRMSFALLYCTCFSMNKPSLLRYCVRLNVVYFPDKIRKKSANHKCDSKQRSKKVVFFFLKEIDSS